MNRFKNIKIKSMIIASMMAAMVMSCNTEESCADLGTCPESTLIERTDLVIEGALSISDHQVLEVTGVKDGPVDYNFYGDPSESFDFLIELSSGHTLVIRMHNEESMHPWEDVDHPFNTYPAQELDDKYSYVTADLRIGNDAAAYSTHIGHLPQGTGLDVFRITENDGEVIRCRIRNLVLYKNVDNGQSIRVDGTFIAVIAFDEDLAG